MLAALGMWPQRESHPNVMHVILENAKHPSKLVQAQDSNGVTPLHVCTDVCQFFLWLRLAITMLIIVLLGLAERCPSAVVIWR
jgi:hypothetical protein